MSSLITVEAWVLVDVLMKVSAMVGRHVRSGVNPNVDVVDQAWSINDFFKRGEKMLAGRTSTGRFAPL